MSIDWADANEQEQEASQQGPSLPLDSSDLTQFQLRILSILVEEARYGLAIKRELEDAYGEEINHGRLYPNLDQLTEIGYVDVGELDKRTNEYRVTEHGRDALAAEIGYLARGFERGDL